MNAIDIRHLYSIGSFGADCANLSLPLGGASPPPPYTQSSNQESNQGTSSTSRIQNETTSKIYISEVVICNWIFNSS